MAQSVIGRNVIQGQLSPRHLIQPADKGRESKENGTHSFSGLELVRVQFSLGRIHPDAWGARKCSPWLGSYFPATLQTMEVEPELVVAKLQPCLAAQPLVSIYQVTRPDESGPGHTAEWNSALANW